MAISSWLSWPNSRSGARHAKRPHSAARLKKARFTLEPLEARALLASYTASSVSALIVDIQAANSAGRANTITLTAPTTSPYVLTATNNTSTADGPNGLPVIAANNNLTIVGNGDTIERHSLAAFRLFDVAPAASLTLQNLTLTGGSATEGGAIYNQGALTMSGVTVQNNTAVNGGGAIYNQGALTMSGVTVQNNTARNAGGGAIYNQGTLTMSGSSVQNNTGPEGGVPIPAER